MAGLTAVLAVVLAPWLQEAAAAEAAGPVAGSRAAAEEAAALERLDALRAEPRPGEESWRAAVFQLLVRLEQAPLHRVLWGWDALAAGGADGDLSNRILYLRRHGLSLPERQPGEGLLCALERALALWGERRLDEAAAALEEGSGRYPEETVFRENWLWLRMRAPERVDPLGGARGAALAVLAARRART